jgi:hypothetical protein
MPVGRSQLVPPLKSPRTEAPPTRRRRLSMKRRSWRVRLAPTLHLCCPLEADEHRLSRHAAPPESHGLRNWVKIPRSFGSSPEGSLRPLCLEDNRFLDRASLLECRDAIADAIG